MQSVTTHALRRDFGHLRAVDDLDLDLPSGGVIALVGPNGSGKSTLIRMILGLIRPTSGEATVLGRSIHDPSQYAADVGALIESPAFVPALSARKNLLSLSRLRRLPDTRVDEVLETVGLTGRDEEAVKRFSLGMKQRLGIAAALLPDPQLLILDEPTNGLDPAAAAGRRRPDRGGVLPSALRTRGDQRLHRRHPIRGGDVLRPDVRSAGPDPSTHRPRL